MSTTPPAPTAPVQLRPPPTDGPSPAAPRSPWRGMPRWSGAAIALLLLCIGTAIYEPAFLRPTNLVNILEQNATIGMVAIGMTLVIILGGIDLSVGSLVALAGGVGVLALNSVFVAPEVLEAATEAAAAVPPEAGPAWLELRLARLWEGLGIAGSDAWAVVVAVIATAIVGVLGGLFNGVLVAYGRIVPFIATLATLSAYRSCARWMRNGGQFFSEGSETFATLGEGFAIPGTSLELPWSVLIWLVVAVLAAVLLNRMRLGRYITAVGSNERAAVYSAIPVNRVKLMTYAIVGGIVGIAAVCEAANYESINSAQTGLLWELNAIAAVVTGGTRMQGGSGSVAGAVIGVLLLGVIGNMLVMLGITSHAQGLVLGLIIIVAALLQRIGRRD